jgi:hypothetical protein
MRSRCATERRENFELQNWSEKFKLLDLERAHLKHPFYSSQHALGWSGEFAVSVRSPSMAYDSWSDLSCLLVVWISQRWVVTYVAQWFSPPKIGLREGGPKEKLVVEERFFKPSTTSPLIRKMQHEYKMRSETKGRLCCFVLVVWVVHLKLLFRKTHAAQDVTLIKNCFALSCKICCWKFCSVLTKIVLSLRDSTHLILEQTQANM